MLQSQQKTNIPGTRRLTTYKQREAARRNGTKSKGPITAAGKARSSRNNLKHGIYAKTLDLSLEPDYFHKFRTYLNHFLDDSPQTIALIHSKSALLPVQAASSREFFRFQRFARSLNFVLPHPNPATTQPQSLQQDTSQKSEPNLEVFHNPASITKSYD